MNTKIIIKCIEELKKDTFSKEYVLGMLETYVEMSGGVISSTLGVSKPLSASTPNMVYSESNVDEEMIPDAAMIGPVATLTYGG